MNKVSKNVGKCLTETKRVDFDEAVNNFGEFVSIGQFADQPKHVSEVPETFIKNEAKLHPGYVLYGIDTENGSLTWIGQIIDSSD